MDNSSDGPSYDGNFSHCFTDDGIQVGPIIRDVIFLIIGIMGNFCLLTTIFKKMRTVPNYLIANLTIVDTGFIILLLPYTIARNLAEEGKNYAFIRSDLGCKIFEFSRLVFMGVSISTLTALSIDRYLAVSKPMLAYSGVRSGRQRLYTVLLGIALIWIGAFIVSFPNLIMAQHFMNNNTFSCYVSPWHDFFQPYVYSAVVVYLAAPTCIIVFCYCCMARSLLKRNALLDGNGGKGNASREKRRQRVRLAVAVIIIVIVFVATWSIYYITELLRHHEVHAYWDERGCFTPHTSFLVLHKVATILLRVNPVINPIILFAVSSSHRYYAKQIFCCCLPDKSKNHKFGKSISLTAQSTAESRLLKNNESQKTKRELRV